MSIGYACLIYGFPQYKFKSCILKNATEKHLKDLIRHNLITLSNIIDYNISNRIALFRISSDIIPFASHPSNKLNWQSIFKKELAVLGNKIKDHEIRVSMHPGQYTVINSPKPDVVERAFNDLEYHSCFLDSLKLDSTHKIVLHIGGVYGDKNSAIERFKSAYSHLDPSIKSRLVIENDEKSYDISDVLNIGNALNIPVVFDNLHHRINGSDTDKSESSWIKEVALTWKSSDGVQKIHYSQQRLGGKSGAHSFSINIDEFLNFFDRLKSPVPDIMLEVKDKNISAIKCNNCISSADLTMLQREWARYKYLVLYHCHRSYLDARSLFRFQKNISGVSFYRKVEYALAQKPSIGSMVNAFSHIWGYFKKICTEGERSSFKKNLYEFSLGNISPIKFKKFLYKLSVKYNVEYLLDSYFFHDIF